VSDDRNVWDQLRRALLQAVAVFSKTRPNDRYTIDVRVVERPQQT
jgi:hypothetical protein